MPGRIYRERARRRRKWVKVDIVIFTKNVAAIPSENAFHAAAFYTRKIPSVSALFFIDAYACVFT